MAKKYLDYDGLLYFWQKLKTTFAKTVDVPTKTSDLTNDSGYITSASVPSATTTTPKMDGTASVGSETKWAKGDHVHPTDTSRVPTTRKVNGKALSADVTLYAGDVAVSSSDSTTVASALSNKVDKVTGKGLSTNDYTTAEKTKLSGIAEGAEVNVNADWNATTGDAQILNKPTIPSAGTGTNYPLMDGTKALGTQAGYARVDHVHPSDTTKVDKVTGKGLSTNDYTTEEKEKLAGIKAGANTILNVAEVTDPVEGWYINGSYDKDGTTSSIGWYDANCIDGFFANAASQMGTALNGKVDKTSVGQASGVCPLDANSKVDAQYLPSYVDDVIEAYARSGQTALSQNWLATGSATGTVITPEAGKIYVLMADSGDYSANTQFRWSGTTYVKLADGGVSSITNAEIDTIVAS